MYAKCSGSPWLLQIPAEDDEGKGKLRWELEIGRSLARCLFLTRKTSFAATLFPFFCNYFIIDQLWLVMLSIHDLCVVCSNSSGFISWKKRCIHWASLNVCCGSGLYPEESGNAFCGIFLVALHERFSGHSVWTTLRRRTQSVRSARSHTFKWMYMCLLCV